MRRLAAVLALALTACGPALPPWWGSPCRYVREDGGAGLAVRDDSGSASHSCGPGAVCAYSSAREPCEGADCAMGCEPSCAAGCAPGWWCSPAGVCRVQCAPGGAACPAGSACREGYGCEPL